MNRNDMFAPVSSAPSNATAAAAAPPTDDTFPLPTLHPSKSLSSLKQPPVVSPRQSPRRFRPTSAGSLARPSFPMAPLLDDKSMHLPMPSFHDRNRSTVGWCCAGCGSVNQSALSNECSVCGMLRNIDFEEEDVSETMAADGSFSSLANDCDVSETSLSLNTLAVSEKQPEIIEQRHMSLPSSAFQNSFSSFASVRTSRTTAYRRSGSGSTFSRMRAGLREDNLHEENDDSSVMSFAHWNGNEKVKPWTCSTCTYINENPLHLLCEMCGTRRGAEPPGTTTVASAAAALDQVPLDHSTTTDDGLEDRDLELLREEQIRELITVQREIMSGFVGGSGVSVASSANESRFSTLDLQQEIGQLNLTTSTASRLDYNDLDTIEYGTEGLDEILKAQEDIIADFKRKRTSLDDDETSHTDPTSSYTAPKKYATSSPARSRRSLRGGQDNLFGSLNNEPNTTPNTLRQTMRAAGGKLRQEDLCMPILWGDSLDKSEKATMKSTAAAT